MPGQPATQGLGVCVDQASLLVQAAYRSGHGVHHVQVQSDEDPAVGACLRVEVCLNQLAHGGGKVLVNELRKLLAFLGMQEDRFALAGLSELGDLLQVLTPCLQRQHFP